MSRKVSKPRSQNHGKKKITEIRDTFKSIHLLFLQLGDEGVLKWNRGEKNQERREIRFRIRKRILEKTS